jgi:hypothetical protein
VDLALEHALAEELAIPLLGERAAEALARLVDVLALALAHARLALVELDGEGREAVLELRAVHQPLRDLLRRLDVVELGEVDALLVELAHELRAHLVVPVVADAGRDELRDVARRLAPLRIRLDRVGDGVERIDDDLELEQVGALVEHAHVLVVVGHRSHVEGRHHVHDRVHRVRVLAPLVPVAVGLAVAVAVLLRGVGQMLRPLGEVGETVAVAVGVRRGGRGREEKDRDEPPHPGIVM